MSVAAPKEYDTQEIIRGFAESSVGPVYGMNSAWLTEENHQKILDEHGWRFGPGGTVAFQWKHRTGTPMLAVYFYVDHDGIIAREERRRQESNPGHRRKGERHG